MDDRTWAQQAPDEDGEARPSGTPDTPADSLRRLTPDARRHGEFEDEREIARGGMGAILRTWDPNLRRELARKVLLADSKPTEGPRPVTEADERVVSRFLDEAQITGQLDHPGIVPVHELGIDSDGRLYFTMRLVRGQDLERVFRQLRAGEPAWTRARVLQILLKVCEAMAYAHSKGIVHRDLKPANVMIGRFGEVYVMDWGLARVLDREDRLDIRLVEGPSMKSTEILSDRGRVRKADQSSPLITMDGDVVGTPAYMAPEQARGELDKVDCRSDVYSIGAMLYQLMTGFAPYQDTSSTLDNLSTWRAVKHGPPRELQAVVPKAPAELVAICEKAMAREPGDRYPDTRELEQDLRSYLEGRVVRAYGANAFVQIWKWVRRNKATAGALATIVTLLLASTTTISILESRSNRALAKKNEELALASEELAEARDEALDSAAEAEEQRRRATDLAVEADTRAAEAVRERDASERLVLFLEDLFASSAPEISRGDDLLVREVLAVGARDLVRLEDEPLLAARMREAMGKAYLGLGLFEDAEPLFERALQDRDALLPETDPARATSANDLGLLRYHQARYEDSRQLLERALALRIAHGGDTAPAVQESRFDLALLARKEGRLDDASGYLEAVLEVQEANPEATEAVDLLHTRNALGGVVLRQGSPEAATPLLESAYLGRLELLGEDHPDTLISQNDLAFALSILGEWTQARELYESCLEQQLAVHGARHPFTLSVQNNLAALLRDMGEVEPARILWQDALEVAREELGASHPTTLGILNGLAAAELGLGAPEIAASLFEEVLSGLLESFEPTHPNVLTLRESLVTVYVDLERTTDALRHARALLAASEEGSSEHARHARTVEDLERRD